MAATRVLVVDDYRFALATLTAALEARRIEVRAVSSAREAHAAAMESRPNAALIDLDLGPGPTGLDLAHSLRKLLPAIGLVILTNYRDPRLAGIGLPSWPMGAIYLCKADVVDVGKIVDAINQVARSPLERRSAAQMVSGPSVSLTDMQVEVLLMVGSGATTAEIAARRGVSTSAVEQTLARICDHLGIERDPSRNQRVQLVQALNRLRGQVAAP